MSREQRVYVLASTSGTVFQTQHSFVGLLNPPNTETRTLGWYACRCTLVLPSEQMILRMWFYINSDSDFNSVCNITIIPVPCHTRTGVFPVCIILPISCTQTPNACFQSRVFKWEMKAQWETFVPICGRPPAPSHITNGLIHPTNMQIKIKRENSEFIFSVKSQMDHQNIDVICHK